MVRNLSRPALPLLFSLAAITLLAVCGREEGPFNTGGDSGTLTLMVTSDPESAQIFIDNVFTGAYTPADTSTEPVAGPAGDHTLTLRLCDYEEWSEPYSGADGDTLSVHGDLSLKFEFFEDFDSLGIHWSAGCPITFSQLTPVDDTSGTYATIFTDTDCETRLLDAFELPDLDCGHEPRVSFHYKLITSGGFYCALKVIVDGVTRGYDELAQTDGNWEFHEVQPGIFDDLTGDASFTFELRPAEGDTIRFSLDNFSLGVE